MCVYLFNTCIDIQIHASMFRIVSACYVHVYAWSVVGFAVKFVRLPIRKADLTIQDGRGYSPLHNATRPAVSQHSAVLNGSQVVHWVLHLPDQTGGGTWMWSSFCWPMELPQESEMSLLGPVCTLK